MSELDSSPRPPFDVSLVGACMFGGFGVLTILIGIVVTVAEGPEGLFAVAFGALFLGAAWLVRFLFAVPEGQRQVTVEKREGTVPHRSGQAQRRVETRILVDEDASPEEVAAAKAAWVQESLAQRPDWLTGPIQSEDQLQGAMPYVGAGIWGVFLLGVSVWALLSGADLVSGLICVGVVSLPAGYVIGSAALTILRRRRFTRPSLCSLETLPARLGQPLRAVVQTGIETSTELREPLQVSLTCIERWEETVSDSDSAGSRTRSRSRELWSENQQVEAAPLKVEEVWQLTVSFELPADGAPTSLGASGNNGVSWELAVRARLPGVDYLAEFKLPVFDPGFSWPAANPAAGA